ncbi:MAG: fluoride efflux transporter CrcB, partial [Thermoanaerobaculia bacterium]|nr:fluoride efflux transporter CrcB [Thermoanaerobaculia bacterium]
MIRILAIGAGGALGAIARYGLTSWVARAAPGLFPLGTAVVNVAGCLAIGVLMRLVEASEALGPNLRLFLIVGFLGSLTTFSTVGYETFHFLRTGEPKVALATVAVNLAVGLAAVTLGWTAARWLAVG